MLELAAITRAGVTQPRPWWSWMTWPPTLQAPFSQKSQSEARSAPSSRARARTKVFMVEPGSKLSSTARLRRSSRRGALGLKSGTFASARISPVAGFTATAIPDAAWACATAWASERSAASCEALVDGELDAGALEDPAPGPGPLRAGAARGRRAATGPASTRPGGSRRGRALRPRAPRRRRPRPRAPGRRAPGPGSSGGSPSRSAPRGCRGRAPAPPRRRRCAASPRRSVRRGRGASRAPWRRPAAPWRAGRRPGREAAGKSRGSRKTDSASTLVASRAPLRSVMLPRRGFCVRSRRYWSRARLPSWSPCST